MSLTCVESISYLRHQRCLPCATLGTTHKLQPGFPSEIYFCGSTRDTADSLLIAGFAPFIPQTLVTFQELECTHSIRRLSSGSPQEPRVLLLVVY
jgi:hypothetical protein